MKNVLSDSQKYQLANWLVANKDSAHTRSSACKWASHDLGFSVTYSNMTSAETTTGVSLVKVPVPKKSNGFEARIAKLESDVSHLVEIWSGYAYQT